MYKEKQQHTPPAQLYPHCLPVYAANSYLHVQKLFKKEKKTAKQADKSKERETETNSEGVQHTLGARCDLCE